tara:strand:+ start:177 stop:467 length:291 start_codon:yes stop_codon:yes gene_type:complete
MNKNIENIVIEVINDLNDELEKDELNNPTTHTKLYGGNGVLDSMGLVILITDLEERISKEFDKEIVLADEKAMSQRTSPFRNIGTLVKYIQQIIEE